jgi:hypothetical protein
MQYGGPAPHIYLRGDPMKSVRADGYDSTHRGSGCRDLPTRVIDVPSFGKAVQTVWELDGEELAAILQTGRLRLTIIGGQPPVLLEVIKPGEEG